MLTQERITAYIEKLALLMQHIAETGDLTDLCVAADIMELIGWLVSQLREGAAA